MLSPKDGSPNGKAPSVWSLDSGYASMAEDGNLFQSVHATASPSSDSFVAQDATVGLGLQGLDDSRWYGYGSIVEPATAASGLFATHLTDTTPDFHQSIDQDAKNTTPFALPKLDIPTSDQSSICTVCQNATVADSLYSDVCANCSYNFSHGPNSPTDSEYQIRRSRAGRHPKLPQHALSCLQNWLSANRADPYPSAETKRSLAQECGITEKQVTTWFTNARARLLSPTGASPFSGGSDDDGHGESDASITPIEAMGGVAFASELQQHSENFGQHTSGPDAGLSSPISARQQASRRGKKKDYRRNHSVSAPPAPAFTLPPVAISSPEEQYSILHVPGATQHNATRYSPAADPPSNDSNSRSELWQCTFCRKHLVPKSWRRHEETQHRPKAQWTCMLHGPRLLFPSPQSETATKCAFCMEPDPSESHFLHHHRIEECAKRDRSDRTFFRPDHLRQHVKNFHNTTLYDIVQARWKSAAEAGTEGWTCGFCGDKLDTWDKRETHIANHFKDGMRMESWKDHPAADDASSKKGKGKRKDRAQSQIVGMGMLGQQPFAASQAQNHTHSHSERANTSSYLRDAAAAAAPPPPPQLTQQRQPSQHFPPPPPPPAPVPSHQHQRQPFYQPNFPQPQHFLAQSGIANTYHQPMIPYSSPFALAQPQNTAPSLDMLECTNPFTWNTMATSGSTAAAAAAASIIPMRPSQPHQHQLPNQSTSQQPFQQLGSYPLPATSTSSASASAAAASSSSVFDDASFQRQFDDSLQGMGLSAVDLYGNPIEYQGEGGEALPRSWA